MCHYQITEGLIITPTLWQVVCEWNETYAITHVLYLKPTFIPAAHITFMNSLFVTQSFQIVILSAIVQFEVELIIHSEVVGLCRHQAVIVTRQRGPEAFILQCHMCESAGIPYIIITGLCPVCLYLAFTDSDSSPPLCQLDWTCHWFQIFRILLIVGSS